MFKEKTSFSGKISFAYGGLAIVANKVIILNLLGRLLINPFKLKFFQQFQMWTPLMTPLARSHQMCPHNLYRSTLNVCPVLFSQ